MSNRKIAIVSSDKFVNKIKEDLWLKDALFSLGEKADIVSWEDENVSWWDYKSVVLRSCWGYHKHYTNFLEFLKRIELSDVCLFNDPKIVRWNIRKDLQFGEFEAQGVRTVPTCFIKNTSFDLKKTVFDAYFAKQYQKIVLKPIVSGSGDNTFLIDLNDEKSGLNNQISFADAQIFFEKAIFDGDVEGIMIQPFLQGISEGEYSFIFIGSELTHVAIRYPGIFDVKKEPIEIEKKSVDNDTMQFAYQCCDVMNSVCHNLGRRFLYARCDIVKNDGKLFLMEAEMAEPDLLFRTISSEQKRLDVIKKLANEISMRSK